MQDKFEKLVRIIHRKWKMGKPAIEKSHPSEESIACFLENKLPFLERERIRKHLISCDSCSEAIASCLRLNNIQEQDVPHELAARAMELVALPQGSSILEIYLKLRDRALEILSTSGNVLVEQELVSEPVLRSRQIKEFCDFVVIMKYFQHIMVEARIENIKGEAFNLIVILKEKSTQKPINDLRATLIKNDLELESYLADTGKVVFEHILLGKYTVDISNVVKKVASILIDIK